MRDVAKKIEAEKTAELSDRYLGFRVNYGEWDSYTVFPKVRLCSTFSLHFAFDKKNGDKARVKTTANIFYTYCPFCGEKYPE